ncbi:MAG: hypothetical protein J5860_04190 [Clostridia bacterium]|nr:hypothetical protein [Clostridia bacterium]MBO4428693.1 hypothetical protein [Clostridia bacterium]
MALKEKIKNIGFVKKISEKIQSIDPAKRKEVWENVRMVLILMCMAAPFIFLIVMILGYFL